MSADETQTVTLENARNKRYGEIFIVKQSGGDMLHSADAGIGKVAGIKLDQRSSQMKTTFVPVIPHLLANMLGQYREQVTWRDAGTGRILAESDFFEPLSPGSLIVPGFGGRVYFPTNNGFVTLQVRPEAKPSP